MVCDCCHSGGMLDHEKIVISGNSEKRFKATAAIKKRGISVKAVMGDMEDLKGVTKKKNRSLDIETLTAMMKDLAKRGRTFDMLHVRYAWLYPHDHSISP